MKEERKTKAQLIKELGDLKRRIDELEDRKNEDKPTVIHPAEYESIPGIKTLTVKHAAINPTEYESRFRNIFENSKDGIIFFDGNTHKIIHGNSAMAQLIGCSEEDLAGRSIPSLHPSDEWPGIEKEFRKHVSGELQFSTGIPVLRDDGSVIFADVSSSMITLDEKTYFSAFFRDITDRKRAEEELRESEKRYRFLTENMNDILWIMDMDLQTVYVTPSMETVLGFSPEERTQQNFREQLTPDSLSIITETLLKELALEKQGNADSRRHVILALEFYHKNGSTRWLESIISGIRDDQGALTGLYGASRDITGRKQAEEAIRKSEEKYRTILNTLEDSYFETDLAGKITFANDAMIRGHGYPPEELAVINYRRYTDAENAEIIFREFNRIYRTGESFRGLQYEVITNKGERRTVETSASLIRDTAGIPIGFRGISRDITDLRKTQKALQESEERFRHAAESSNDIIYECDIKTGHIDWFSNAPQRIMHLLGEIPDTVETFQKLIHPDDYERIRQETRQRIRDRLRYLAEYRVVNKAGEIFHFQGSGTGLYDHNGRAYKWIGTISDITERKNAEESLRQAEEKYRSIVENAVEGFFQTDPYGKITMVNSAGAKILGYDSPKELMAGVFVFADHIYVNPAERNYLFAKLYHEGQAKDFEMQFYTKTGAIKWGSLNVHCVLDDQGEELYYEGTIEDITSRKKAERALHESLEKLRKSMGGIVQAMSMTIETRDPYTAGHQRRVADLARSIAHEMGLSPDQVDSLRMAGHVHDLGKISVPAEILSKTSKLSAIEYKLVQVHPQIGYDILKDIDFPWPLAEMVLQHHERMDGSGYPQGLSASDILPESRILSVADVVEAISSHRPYRPAFGVDAALEEIEKNKGKLYDPVVVDACLKLFRENGYKLV
ncbi:MAG: PAS domain S-box protein [Deltaproteobacteria bacterium]|nr:PAS domain S-box protein [Deltaproteobacteria bacterium]